MTKNPNVIFLSSCMFLASAVGSDSAEASWWNAVGNWFHQAAETINNDVIQPVAHVADTIVNDAAQVVDSAVQLATIAADTVTHFAATAATVVTNVAATGAGDITGDHTLFNNVAAHTDAAIAGAADAVTVATNAVSTLAKTGIDAAALTITHPQDTGEIAKAVGTSVASTVEVGAQEEGEIGEAETLAQEI